MIYVEKGDLGTYPGKLYYQNDMPYNSMDFYVQFILIGTYVAHRKKTRFK